LPCSINHQRPRASSWLTACVVWTMTSATAAQCPLHCGAGPAVFTDTAQQTVISGRASCGKTAIQAC
jgi:hypothetical protein